MAYRGTESRRESRYDDGEYTDSGSQEDCCVCISRNFVFWCNVALLIFGLAAMGFSIYLWVMPDLAWAGDDLALKFTICAAFLIILGLMGITGTWDEVERCDLIVYLILITGIIIAQIALVVYAATNEDSLQDYLEGIWDDWSDARKEEAMEAYDCGLYHPISATLYLKGENDVNINQEPLEIANCKDAADTIDYCFEDCYNEVKDAITTIGALTSTFLIIFALFEFMLLISSFILVCNPADYEDSTDEWRDQRRQQPMNDQADRQRGPRKQQGHHNQRGNPQGGQTRGAQNVQMTRGQAVY